MKTLVTAAISMPVDASVMEGINFLNMPEAILVFAHEVLPRWSPLVERDGERYFATSSWGDRSKASLAFV